MGDDKSALIPHLTCKCKDCSKRFTIFYSPKASPFDPLKHGVCPHCGSESYWIIGKSLKQLRQENQQPDNGE